MLTLVLAYPAIDPVLVEVGPLQIRWYSLAYVAGILMGWWYIGWLDRKKPHALTQPLYDAIFIWAVIGVVAGGRLGYVFFYKFLYYAFNPIEIFYIWQGGMSFHGGMLGMIFATYLCCRQHKVSFWPVMDLAACAAPMGLFFGRIANFINGELYGRVTDSPLGMVFPHSGDGLPRHPSQLYEAVLEGLVLFLILLFFAKKTDARYKPRMLSGIFLLGYGAARFVVEYFREPDAHLGFIVSHFSMGQLLCLPMIFYGGYLAWQAHHAGAKRA